MSSAQILVLILVVAGIVVGALIFMAVRKHRRSSGSASGLSTIA